MKVSLNKTQTSVHGSAALCWALSAFSVSWSFTQSVGLLGRGNSPSQGRYLHTEQHKQNKCTQPFMPRVVFEHTIPTIKRAKTVDALDRAAIVIGSKECISELNDGHSSHNLTLFSWPVIFCVILHSGFYLASYSDVCPRFGTVYLYKASHVRNMCYVVYCGLNYIWTEKTDLK
jgi:hypothetical protein